jgi:hypothetical protein
MWPGVVWCVVGGQPIRSLFTPRDARAHFILYPCASPHGGRLKDPMTWLHAHGPCACSRQGPSISAQGVRKWEGQRSRRSATRATAAPRPERIKKAFDFAAWKGGVRCSDAVLAMAAWLARCRPAAVQRAARSHATASGSPIREEFGRLDVQVSALAGRVSQTPRRRCMATSEPSASPKQSKKCNPALRIFQPLEACTRSRWVSLEKE